MCDKELQPNNAKKILFQKLPKTSKLLSKFMKYNSNAIVYNDKK